MIKRTYTTKQIVIHALFITFLLIISTMLTISIIYNLLNINCREDLVAICVNIIFDFLMIASIFFESRAYFSKIYITDEGLGIKRFKKVKVFIKWSDIKDIGICHIPTPYGSDERIYFAEKVLTDEEKENMITLKHHTVHFTYIPKSWYQKMTEHLPLEIPLEIKEKYVK